MSVRRAILSHSKLGQRKIECMAFVRISSQISVGAPYTLKYFMVLFNFSKSGNAWTTSNTSCLPFLFSAFDHLINPPHLEFSAFLYDIFNLKVGVSTSQRTTLICALLNTISHLPPFFLPTFHILDPNTLWLPAAIWTLLLVFLVKFIISSCLNPEHHTILFFVSLYYGFYYVERKMETGCGIRMCGIFTCVYYTNLLHCYTTYCFICSLMLCCELNYLNFRVATILLWALQSDYDQMKGRYNSNFCFLAQTMPPHCRGFEITQRHTMLHRTPLDEESARCRGLYLTT